MYLDNEAYDAEAIAKENSNEQRKETASHSFDNKLTASSLKEALLDNMKELKHNDDEEVYTHGKTNNALLHHGGEARAHEKLASLDKESLKADDKEDSGNESEKLSKAESNHISGGKEAKEPVKNGGKTKNNNSKQNSKTAKSKKEEKKVNHFPEDPSSSHNKFKHQHEQADESPMMGSLEEGSTTGGDLLEDNLMKMDKKKLVHLLAKFMRNRKSTSTSSDSEKNEQTPLGGGILLSGGLSSTFGAHPLLMKPAAETTLQNVASPSKGGNTQFIYMPDLPSKEVKMEQPVVEEVEKTATRESSAFSKPEHDPYIDIGSKDPADGDKSTTKQSYHLPSAVATADTKEKKKENSGENNVDQVSDSNEGSTTSEASKANASSTKQESKVNEAMEDAKVSEIKENAKESEVKEDAKGSEAKEEDNKVSEVKEEDNKVSEAKEAAKVDGETKEDEKASDQAKEEAKVDEAKEDGKKTDEKEENKSEEKVSKLESSDENKAESSTDASDSKTEGDAATEKTPTNLKHAHKEPTESLSMDELTENQLVDKIMEKETSYNKKLTADIHELSKAAAEDGGEVSEKNSETASGEEAEEEKSDDSVQNLIHRIKQKLSEKANKKKHGSKRFNDIYAEIGSLGKREVETKTTIHHHRHRF